VDREVIFKTTGIESFNEINNDNGLKVILYTKSVIMLRVPYFQITMYNKADGHVLNEIRSRTDDIQLNRRR
jgi:hypothetical protein